MTEPAREFQARRRADMIRIRSALIAALISGAWRRPAI